MSKLTFITTFVLLALPSILFAEGTAQSNGFVPLVGVPFLDNNQAADSLIDYVNAFYIGSISLAAVIAVLRIIYAGIQYMLSDVVTSKGKAKKDIQAALVGLIIIIGAVLILDTINPSIKMVNPLSLKPLSLPAYTDNSQNGSGAQTPTTFCDNLRKNFDDCIVVTCSQIIEEMGSNYQGCKKDCETSGGVFSGGAITGSCYRSKQESDKSATYSVTTITCGTNNTPTCSEATKNCMNDSNYDSVQQSDANTLICKTRKITLDGGNTNIDRTITYKYLGDQNSSIYGVSGKIVSATTNANNIQLVTIQNSSGSYTVGCSEITPNPTGCNLPTERKISTTPGQIYYQKQNADEITGNYPKQQITFLDNYQTIDGFVYVKLNGGNPTLLSCSYIVPSVCKPIN